MSIGLPLLCLKFLLLLLLCRNVHVFARSLAESGPETALRSSQEKLKKYFETEGHEHRVTEGRGIVIPAGGRKQLTNAFIVCKAIREDLNSNLPIEVYFDGAGEADLAVFSKLQAIPGVFLRDAHLLTRPDYLSPWPKHLNGYAKKIFSLFSTGFQQVLLLDSDSQPLMKPELLFELDDFKRVGSVFWPDLWDGSNRRRSEVPRPEAYSLLGLPDPRVTDRQWFSAESGQVLFDKGRHADVVDWVMWLNINANVMYQYMLGDKDTFEMGFMLSGKHDAFYRVPLPPRSALTNLVQGRSRPVHAFVALVQMISDRPAFLHRVSEGKLDYTEPSSDEQKQPAFITEPIDGHSFSHLRRDNVDGMWGTVHAAEIDTSVTTCEKLSLSTQTAVRHALAAEMIDSKDLETAESYSECSGYSTGRAASPFVALAVDLYGQNIVRSISHSNAAFQEIRDFLRLELVE